MIQDAGDKIIISLAGKDLDSNVEEIRKITGAKEVHGSRIVGNFL